MQSLLARSKGPFRRRLVIVSLTVVGLGVLLLFGVLFAAPGGCFRPIFPLPRSDVPVTSDLGSWWGLTRNVQIEDLQVEVVDARLGLFNDRALVRFRLIGNVTHESDGWRPYISAFQMSQRLRFETTSRPFSDIELLPVVALREDKGYSREKIHFDVAIEKHIEALNWGATRYTVVAGDRIAEFILHRPK
jgi:hypothetical protein